jgi:AraC-like DNA-binding protein
MPPEPAPPPDATRIPKYDMRLGPDSDGSALALYRQNVELLYRLEFAADAAARFHSHAVTYQLPHSVLASVESVAQTMRRGPDEIARGGDQIVLHAMVAGEVDAVYGGRARRVRPGDVAVIDYTGEIESRATDFSIIYLMVTRDMVPPQFLQPAAHGTVFTADSGAGRLLYRTIQTLLQSLDTLTLAQASAAVDGVLTMTAGLLEDLLSADAHSGATQLASALAVIDRELRNPELSPALLEAHLPLSRSGLYRLFEPLGGVRAAILQRRLDRAMKILLSGKSSKSSLRTIARNHGFQSEEQFRRSFRARFDLTPAQFYEMVRRKDDAGLATLAERAGFANLQAWIASFPADADR